MRITFEYAQEAQKNLGAVETDNYKTKWRVWDDNSFEKWFTDKQEMLTFFNSYTPKKTFYQKLFSKPVNFYQEEITFDFDKHEFLEHYEKLKRGNFFYPFNDEILANFTQLIIFLAIRTK
jgi:hypothetical protein